MKRFYCFWVCEWVSLINQARDTAEFSTEFEVLLNASEQQKIALRMFAIIEKTHYTTWRSVSFGLKAHPAHKINARHTNKSGTTAFVPTNCADDCNVFSITLCLCSRVAAVALIRINFQLASPATRMPFWLMQDEPLIHSHLCQISIHLVCSVRYRKRNFPSDIIGAENALVRNQAEIFSVNGR